MNLATFLFWLTALFLPSSQPQIVITTTSGSSNVSIDTNNAYYAAGTLSSCADASAPNCQVTTSMVVPHTGDAVQVWFRGCPNAGCSGASGTFSVSDGTNTYVQDSNSSSSFGGGFFVENFVACNATAGTYTLVISNASTQFYYMAAESINYLNAKATGCVDTSVSNIANGSSAAPSVTSAGNVTNTGEVVQASIVTSAQVPTNGACTLLNSNNTDGTLIVYALNPSSGATKTCAATVTSTSWWASIIGITK